MSNLLTKAFFILQNDKEMYFISARAAVEIKSVFELLSTSNQYQYLLT